jgi:plasmid maintenance system antidote protein VapI
MEPGFYTYKLKTTGETIIVSVLRELAGLADCICLYPGGATIFTNMESMPGEWGEKIEFKPMRKPAEVFHPGVHLLDELKARGWTNRKFAKKCIYPTWFINKVVCGDENINFKIAETFGRVLGTSAEYWLNLQKAWDERNKS